MNYQNRENIKNNKRRIGQEYENIAANFLIKNGLSILNRNFYTRAGEIDIIAMDGDTFVFTEVKYRRSNSYGFPEESVNVKKQQRIRRGARIYLYLNHINENSANVRFDVVSVSDSHIKWLKAAF